MITVEVSTPYGRVRGRQHDGICVFRAVPYAATPRGAARFAGPRAPSGWEGVRDAGDVPVAVAPAPPRDRIGDLDMTPLSGDPWNRADDDYLTATIWSRDVTKTTPVLVFVHGGGFLAGTGAAAAYDGTSFARDGVVVVNVNYRLGVPGWLHVDGAPDNRGLLDVVAALQWVRDNIRAFGGDPEQVTVMGQSAGATLVAGLLASPLAAGLFHRAISQSGNGAGAFTRQQAQRVTETLADALGVPATVKGFADIPDDVLVDRATAVAGLDLDVAGALDPMLGLSPFCLVLDPATVPVQPADAVAAGSVRGVDLLIGTNADEANLYLVPTGRLGSRDAQAMADHLFGAGTDALATAHTSTGEGDTYRYQFAWTSDAYDGTLGAAHTVELPFVFATTHLPRLRGDRSLLGSARGAAQVSEAVHAAWVAFIRHGRPGWPAATIEQPNLQVLGLMSARTGFRPAGWADSGVPLSPAVRKGPFIQVSGQIAIDPATGATVGTSVTEQVQQVFRNLTSVLNAAGARLDDVIGMHVYLQDPADFSEMNAAYATWAPVPAPARTTVYMPLPGDFVVEIDALAVADE